MSNKQKTKNKGRKDIIFEKADKLAVEVYSITKKLPKEELYGYTSQLRRSALSVVLNIVEGYARQQRQEHRRFLEIAYGSVKEVMYLLKFGVKIKYLNHGGVEELHSGYEEVARMLWTKIQTLKKQVKSSKK